MPDGYNEMLETQAAPFISKSKRLPDIVHLFAKTQQQFLDGMSTIKEIKHPK